MIRCASTARSESRRLPGHLKLEFIEPAESGQVSATETRTTGTPASAESPKTTQRQTFLIIEYKRRLIKLAVQRHQAPFGTRLVCTLLAGRASVSSSVQR
ncbi:hypothetical protein B586_13655 [Mycobacterium haemophilum DSM 44634]|nr:hypothetical protein B586_13655 [Mycobacterium haemophilum DSM 44634]